MLQSIILPFTTILVAELLDKSQLALILLSTKTKHHLQLILGALLAFALVDGAAILFGSVLVSIIPELYIKIAAALTFFYFGITSLRAKEEKADKITSGKNAFLSALSVIFLSEWGDKTQIASAVFATRFPPFAVFIGVMLAMLVLAVLAVYLGKLLDKKIPAQTIRKVAGILFILLGVVFLII